MKMVTQYRAVTYHDNGPRTHRIFTRRSDALEFIKDTDLSIWRVHCVQEHGRPMSEYETVNEAKSFMEGYLNVKECTFGFQPTTDDEMVAYQAGRTCMTKDLVEYLVRL